VSRPRRGYSPSLDKSPLGDPRSRQSTDTGINSQDIAAPLALDSQGRATVAPSGALAVTPDGKLGVNVDHGLAIHTGSPQRVVVRTGRTVIVDRASGNLETNVSVADIRGLREFVHGLIHSTAPDISYAEPIVADAYTDPEAPFIYSEDGTDVLVSEVLH